MGFLDYVFGVLVGAANASASQNNSLYQNFTPEQRRVYELTKMGIQLSKTSRYEEALEYFLEANRLMPNETIIQNYIKLCRKELAQKRYLQNNTYYADTDNIKFVKNNKSKVGYGQNYINKASKLEPTHSINNYNESSNSNYYRRYCAICNKRTKFVGSSSDDKYMYCSVCYSVIGTENNDAPKSTSYDGSDAHELHLKKIRDENIIKKELLDEISFGELYEEYNYQIGLFGEDSSINKSKKEDLINYFMDNYTLSDLKDMFD